MQENNLERKLRAILSADVKGYSLLMADDEIATIRTITSYRTIMKSIIEQYKGRIVDTPGDNLLAEFKSVMDAVQCAVDIQRDLKAKNDELPPERRMDFRIGVNLGDIIQDGDRIYGDGVNIAARIERMADPGGISISGTAFDSVMNKLDIGFQYSGEQKVKNIANPVRHYKILMDPAAAGKVIGAKWYWGRLSYKVAMISILFLVILTGAIAAFYIYVFQSEKTDPASMEKMAFPLPAESSIAVLPFDNLSGDPDQAYLCDGFTEQIITNLSMVPKLFVIARNSTFTYKGKPVKVQQVAEELGVQYVLEGSIQKAGDKIRINVQLIDAISGRHLWAEKYDRVLNDIFAIQDEITLKIISAVGAEVTRGERARINAIGTNNVEAYLKVMQGWEYYFGPTRETNLLARKLAEEAIALDPEFQNAYCLLASTHFMEVFLGTTKSPRESFETATTLFEKVLAVDEAHPIASGTLAYVYGMQRQYDQALTQAQRAVEQNPGRANVYFYLGSVLYFAGNYTEALIAIEKAIRLDPKGPSYYFLALGHSYRGLGQYKEALAQYKKTIERAPNYWIAHAFLAATYIMAGQEEMARAAAADVLKINPKFSLDKLARSLPYKDKEYKERAIDAMRMAGLS